MSTRLAPPAGLADTTAVQVLFKEARRRRRRRWLTGIAVVGLTVAVAAASAVTVAHRAPGPKSGRPRQPAAAPAAASSVAAVWIDDIGLHIGYLHPGGSVTQRLVAVVNADALPLLRAGGRVYWVDPAGTFMPALGHWSQVVRYLDVATGRMGIAGPGQTVFLSARLAVFLNAGSSNVARLAIVDLATGAVRIAPRLRLPLGMDIAWARWWPGGADLIAGAATGTTYLVDTATLSARPLVETPGSAADINYTAAIVPRPG